MNSPVCVDASLIIRTLVPGPFTDGAIALMGTWRRKHTTLIAPALLAFEVTSTLRRYVHFKKITSSHGDKALKGFQRIDIRLSHRQEVFPLAWKLATMFNQPTAYDTAYLAMAQLRNCDFWTADEKLFNVVKGQLGWVRWVGEYSPNRNGEGNNK